MKKLIKFCAGVTGTNGKSTVSCMLEHIFVKVGWRTARIGTLGGSFMGTHYPHKLTTPSPKDLHSLLNVFHQRGAEALVIETSSIGLHQDRTAGIDFKLAVFTNLTEDHLDYHKNKEEYFLAKKKLFLPGPDESLKKTAVVNVDDVYGQRLIKELTSEYGKALNIITYGKKGGQCSADFQWDVLSSDLKGSDFKVFYKGEEEEGFLPIPGDYNVSNGSAALAGVLSAGFSLKPALKALESFPGVKGRLELVHKNPFVFVDYAHTPQALRTVLSFLKKNKSQGKLCTVFGCGGERDKEKRPKMGETAVRFSDQVILTSDNPRGEDERQIIEDAMGGVPAGEKEKVIVEIDRKKAIELALSQVVGKDIVLIAGKGHEEEQIFSEGKTLPFSDKKIVQNFF